VTVKGARPGEFNVTEPFEVAVVLTRSLIVPQATPQTVEVDVANAAGVAVAAGAVGVPVGLARTVGEGVAEGETPAVGEQLARTMTTSAATSGRTTRRRYSVRSGRDITGPSSAQAEAASSSGVMTAVRQVASRTPTRMIPPPTISIGVGRSPRMNTACDTAKIGTR